MTITECYITFDQPVYYPGQTITGLVVIALDQPKKVRGVELNIEGRAKFKWTDSESYTYRNSEGRYVTGRRSVIREGEEVYLNNRLMLEGKRELAIGRFTYPFTAILPPNVPSTFSGQYGGISYYGNVKVDIPFGTDKTARKHFQVESWFDLNPYPHLKNPAKRETCKKFCCMCCTSGPLTLVAFVPKTGFAKTEVVPVTVEIDNASNVEVNSVKAFLCKRIHWKAQGHSRNENARMGQIIFSDVPENSSKTWSQNIALGGGSFPNIRNCNIITIEYLLKVEASPNGMHLDLELEIPLTIGDIPFHDGESGVPPGLTPYPQSNPAPGGFMAPDPGIAYPSGAGMPNPIAGFNPAAPAPYPAGEANPYPGNVQPSPYLSGPGVNPQGPFPSAPSVNPQAPYSSTAHGDGQGSYLPAQAPYAPPSTQHLAVNQNGPTGYNPPTGGSSVVSQQVDGGHGFYDPSTSLAFNSGLFNESSIKMPTSSLFAPSAPPK